MNKKHNKIIRFLSELRKANSNIENIFLYGSCINLYMMLKMLFPEAKPYYNQIKGHIITEIDNKYYDITGVIYDLKGYEMYIPSKMGYTNKRYKKSFRCMYKENPLLK